MKVAVVILNWNGEKLLAQFLPSVIEHSGDLADIYLADNKSTDDSIVFVRKHFPEVHIIENNENGGYAKGYNDALEEIDADIYCLLNSDVEVTDDWLVPVLKTFEASPEVAAIQPKILDYKAKDSFEYAGAAGGFSDALGYLYCRGRLFSTLEIDQGQYDQSIHIHWASGACFFIRAAVFHDLKGFDDSFFAHQEEVDLCWRIRNAGYKISVAPTSVVYHVGGATLSVLNPKKTYLNFRNSLFTLTKNLPGNRLLIILFLRLCCDGLAAIKFFFEARPKHSWAVLRAHLHYYKQFSNYYKKRQALHQKEAHYYHSRSIIWRYFVLRKQKFSDLNK